MQEMRDKQVRSLGQKDPLEEEMATHSSTLAWKIPWEEEPGGLQSMGCKELDTTERLSTHTLINSTTWTDLQEIILSAKANP